MWDRRTQLVAGLDEHTARIHLKVPNTMFPQNDE
jgi:hypothetical protein